MKIYLFILTITATFAGTTSYYTEILSGITSETIKSKLEGNAQDRFTQREDEKLFNAINYMGFRDFPKVHQAISELKLEDFQDRPYIQIVIYHALMYSGNDLTIDQIQDFFSKDNEVSTQNGNYGLAALIATCFDLSFCRWLTIEDIINLEDPPSDPNYDFDINSTRKAQAIEVVLKRYIGSYPGKPYSGFHIHQVKKETWKKAFLILSKSKQHKDTMGFPLEKWPRHFFWDSLLQAVEQVDGLDFDLQDYIEWRSEAEGSLTYDWDIIHRVLYDKYDYLDPEYHHRKVPFKVPLDTLFKIIRQDQQNDQKQASQRPSINAQAVLNAFQANKYELKLEHVNELLERNLFPRWEFRDSLAVSFDISDEEIAAMNFDKLEEHIFYSESADRSQTYRYSLCHPLTLSRKVDILKIIKHATKGLAGDDLLTKVRLIIRACESNDPDKSDYLNTHLAHRWLGENINDRYISGRFVSSFYKKEDGLLEPTFPNYIREGLYGLRELDLIQEALKLSLEEKWKKTVLNENGAYLHATHGDFDTYSEDRKTKDYIKEELEMIDVSSEFGLFGVNSYHHKKFDLLVIEDSDKGLYYNICQKWTYVKVMEALERAKMTVPFEKAYEHNKALLAIIGLKKKEKQLDFSVIRKKREKVLAFIFNYDQDYCQVPTDASIDLALENLN